MASEDTDESPSFHDPVDGDDYDLFRLAFGPPIRVPRKNPEMSDVPVPEGTEMSPTAASAEQTRKALAATASETAGSTAPHTDQERANEEKKDKKNRKKKEKRDRKTKEEEVRKEEEKKKEEQKKEEEKPDDAEQSDLNNGGDTKHLAFSGKLHAIRARSHVPFEVVRIREDSDGNAGAKRSAENLAYDDTTDAGQAWSAKELDVKNIRSTEAVMVVGEIIPEEIVAAMAKLPTVKASGITTLAELKEATNIFDCTWKRAIIVRRLYDSKSNLFRLVDKRNGLCRLIQLPTKAKDRVVFYEEYMQFPLEAGQDKRITSWKKQLNESVQQYLGRNTAHFLDADELSQRLSPHTEDHASRLEISTLVRGIEMFCITEDPRFALDSLPSLTKQSGYLQGMQRSPEAELQASLTEILEGTDRHSMAELQHIAEACNSLWRLETSGLQITAKALQALANQFKDKSTEELYIEHWLYRSFLTSFQAFFDEWHVISGPTSSMLPSQINRYIMKSYDMARSQSQERGNIWDKRAHDQPDLHNATNGDVCLVLSVCIDQLESCLELVQTCHDTLPRDDSLPFAMEFAEKSIKEIMSLVGSTSDQESHIALLKHAVHIVQTSAVSRLAVLQDTVMKLIDSFKRIQQFRTSQYERRGLSIVAEEDQEDMYGVSDSEQSVRAELHAGRREGKKPDNSGSVLDAAEGSENKNEKDKEDAKDQEKKDKEAEAKKKESQKKRNEGTKERKESQWSDLEDELPPVSNPFDFMDIDDDEEDVEIFSL